MMSHRRGGAFAPAFLAVALAALLGGLALVRRLAEPDPALAAGRADFARYCAECHGANGEGHGPLAAKLETPPADLTRIAARHGGTFHVDDLRTWIDGRAFHAAHGERVMPVWGRILEDDPAAQQRLGQLVAYLWSIQR